MDPFGRDSQDRTIFMRALMAMPESERIVRIRYALANPPGRALAGMTAPFSADAVHCPAGLGTRRDAREGRGPGREEHAARAREPGSLDGRHPQDLTRHQLSPCSWTT